MLTATVRLAALHCLTRKRWARLAAWAHADVECPHASVTADHPAEGTARTHGWTNVRPCVAHSAPTGNIYLSTDLYCIYHLVPWWSHTSKEKQLVQTPNTLESSYYTLGCMRIHPSCLSACGGKNTPQCLGCGIIVQVYGLYPPHGIMEFLRLHPQNLLYHTQGTIPIHHLVYVTMVTTSNVTKTILQ